MVGRSAFPLPLPRRHTHHITNCSEVMNAGVYEERSSMEMHSGFASECRRGRLRGWRCGRDVELRKKWPGCVAGSVQRAGVIVGCRDA